MDAEPLFSIVMATYNRAGLLPRAVNSVLNQTYRNFELIIVDDGSTDNTEETCRSFGDRRIVYFKQETNKGIMAARNRQLELARGEYLALLDDDDELVPEALEVAAGKLSELSSAGIKIVWFDRFTLEHNQRSGYGVTVEGPVRYEDLLCERVKGDFWQVMRRDIIGSGDRFDERLWCGEILLWLRLHRTSKAYYIPKVLYINHRPYGGERVSALRTMLRNVPRVVLTNRALVEEFGQETKAVCPAVYGRRMAILGAFEILNDERAEGRKACLESFKYRGLSPVWIVFMLSFILNGRLIRSLASMFVRALDRVRRLGGRCRPGG
jgi:glycosyltransferase involved in cell wall biosynthesis